MAINDFGGAQQSVTFEIKNKNANGWIIHHDQISTAIWDKFGGNRARGSEELWEAWQVVNGVVYAGSKDFLGWNIHQEDTWTISGGGRGTSGWIDLKSRVWFWPTGFNNVDPSTWGHIRERAGELPATRKKPNGWIDQGGGVRQFQTRWYDTGIPQVKTIIQFDSI